jgi:hypothetical protein
MHSEAYNHTLFRREWTYICLHFQSPVFFYGNITWTLLSGRYYWNHQSIILSNRLGFMGLIFLRYACSQSTEQSPSLENNNRSASQEITRVLQNTKVHYRVHKRPPLDVILSQMNPVHTLTFYFQVLSGTVPSVFPIKSLCAFIISSIRATCSSNPNLLDSFTLKKSVDVYKLRSSSLCNFLLLLLPS